MPQKTALTVSDSKCFSVGLTTDKTRAVDHDDEREGSDHADGFDNGYTWRD